MDRILTTAGQPDDSERARLATLHALALLDSEPEKEFDALVALATQMLECPLAMLNLVDKDRLWVKAASAPSPREIRRDIAFCDQVIRGDRVCVLHDTATDPRFGGSPLVAEGMRFYAGAPLHATDQNGQRHAIGTLCVIDTMPRRQSDAGIVALGHLAALAEALLEARRTTLRATDLVVQREEMLAARERQDRIFRQAERIAAIGSWWLPVPGDMPHWSDNVFRIHGLPVGEHPDVQTAMRFYPPESRRRLSIALTQAIEQQQPFDLECDFVTVDGAIRRVRSMGEPEIVDGRVVGVLGVFSDITDQHILESRLRHSADTDALTGLANRAAFDRRLEEAMASARRSGEPLLLALIDLDGFKAINDTLGHDAGDDVLRMTGLALRQPWLRDCLAARIGGDEFALIITDPALIAAADHVRDRIEDLLHLSVTVDGVTMTSGGSIGIAAFDDTCHSLRDFARRADTMLYAAKRARVGQRRATPTRRAA